jgi:hypothetical protein
MCGKKASASLDTPYCTAHLKTHIANITKERTLKKVSAINANRISTQTLAIKLYELLDTMPELLNVREVLIENQPSMKNPTMKTISSIIFSYFILKGMVQTKKIQNVKLICPSNKLKVGTDANDKLKSIKKEEGGNDRKVYQMTKKIGIMFCKELIKDDPIHLEMINRQKKQDDLCDSFLQAYYYMFCKSVYGVPENVKVILNGLIKPVEDEEDVEENVEENGINLEDLDY